MSELAVWNSPSSPIGELGMGLAIRTTGRAAESRRRAFEFLPRPPRLNLPCAGAILATGSRRTYIASMVKITISAATFAALSATLPLGSVAVEPERAPDGSVRIWLDHANVAKLKAICSPGVSDAILALAEAHAGR